MPTRKVQKKSNWTALFLVYCLSFIHSIFTVLLLYEHGNSYAIRQKSPRTKVRTPTNVKMPLKAHGNNVTLKAM